MYKFFPKIKKINQAVSINIQPTCVNYIWYKLLLITLQQINYSKTGIVVLNPLWSPLLHRIKKIPFLCGGFDQEQISNWIETIK